MYFVVVVFFVFVWFGSERYRVAKYLCKMVESFQKNLSCVFNGRKVLGENDKSVKLSCFLGQNVRI